MSFSSILPAIRQGLSIGKDVAPLITSGAALFADKPQSAQAITQRFVPSNISDIGGNVRLNLGPSSGFTVNRPFPGLNIGPARRGLSDIRNRISGQRAGLPSTSDIASRRGVTSDIRNRLGGLRASLEPGFGAITDTRVDAVRNARDQAVGNLRESLGRRRVLGSSFAEDAEARLRAEFGQAEAETRADAFTEELQSNLAIEQVAANTLQLDDDSFRTQMATVAQELNLNQAEAETLLADVELLRQDYLAQIAQADQAIQELALPADILNGINNIAARNAQFDIQQRIAAEAERGAAAASFGEAAFNLADRFLGGGEGGLFGGLDNIFGGGGSNIATTASNLFPSGSFSFGGGSALPTSFFSGGGSAATQAANLGFGAAGATPGVAAGGFAVPAFGAGSPSLATGAGFGAAAPGAAGGVAGAAGTALLAAAPLALPFIAGGLFGEKNQKLTPAQRFEQARPLVEKAAQEGDLDRLLAWSPQEMFGYTGALSAMMERPDDPVLAPLWAQLTPSTQAFLLRNRQAFVDELARRARIMQSESYRFGQDGGGQ